MYLELTPMPLRDSFLSKEDEGDRDNEEDDEKNDAILQAELC